MIFSELCDLLLLACIILRANDLVHPPLVAGSGTQHAAHQMIFAIRVGKSMKGIVVVHTELFTGHKDRSGGSEGNVALTVADGSGSHGCRCVVSGSRCHSDAFRQF